MNKTIFLFFLLSASLLSVAQSKRVVGYLPTYRFGSNYSIEYCKVTHLNVCFANPDSNGKLQIDDFSAISKRAKEQNPNIIISISLGGGVLTALQMQTWANIINIPVNRPAFISEIIGFVELYNIDGVDFDLEWDAVTKGYSDFVIELKDSLRFHNILLTAALPANYRYPLITDKALAAFDYINIMAYDKTGPWAPNNPGQHSSFEFAEQAISFWKSQGVKSEKLNLGVPFYGYNFDNQNDVFGFSYATIVNANILNADTDQVGKGYYNGRPTIERKVELAAENTGGIMIWELAQDRFDEYSLLSAIHNRFTFLGNTTTRLCGNTVSADKFTDKKYKVYPNPAFKNLYIESKDKKEINVSIFNLLGERLNIFPEKRFNKLVMNVSEINDGIYILIVESPNFHQSTKIAIIGNSN